ncbi:MAG: hypothetical protein AAF074_20350 [Pseudomonadota bacterium]
MIARLYMLANALILMGFALLCQPLSATLFAAGFPVLLAGVILHMILDHVPERTETTPKNRKDDGRTP